jgi:hypothetical protein
MKTPEEAARKYAKKIWKNGRTYRSRIGYSAEDFLAGLAIVGAMAVDAEKEGRTFIYQATNDNGRISVAAVEVDPATVGQYTGLKDKNGKSFWEGDIFKEDDSGIVRSIFRVPGGLAFEDNPVAFGYDHRAPVYPYSSIAEMQNASWLSQCCEIIGNIHDNAGLIKIDEI